MFQSCVSQAQVNELLASLGVPKRALIGDPATSSNGTHGSRASGDGRAIASAAPQLRLRREIRREASGALRRSAHNYDHSLATTQLVFPLCPARYMTDSM